MTPWYILVWQASQPFTNPELILEEVDVQKQPGFSTIHKPRTDIRRSLMLKLPYFGSHEDWDQRRGEISYLFDWFHTWVFSYCLEFEVFHVIVQSYKQTRQLILTCLLLVSVVATDYYHRTRSYVSFLTTGQHLTAKTVSSFYCGSSSGSRNFTAKF